MKKMLHNDFNNIEYNSNDQLVELNGIINNNYIKIIVDTGSNNCCIKKSILKKCNINVLINNNSNILFMLDDTKLCDSIAKLKIKILDNSNKYIEYTIKDIIIINDNEYNNDFDLILGNNFMNLYKPIINFGSRKITINNVNYNF